MPSNSRFKCYFGCDNHGTLHRFPKPVFPHLDKFNVWKKILDRGLQEKENTHIYNQVRLCSKHFEHYYISSSHRLTSNAVPTVCLNALPLQPMSTQNVSPTASVEPLTFGSVSLEPTTSALPKQSPRQLKYKSDKEESLWAEDQMDGIETVAVDKEESLWAEDQMDGIETVAVADDVTTPAPPEYSWQRPPEAIPCADDVEIHTDVSLTTGDGGDDRRPIESYNDRLHLGFNCNECGSEIVGYRYTCVQCCGVELCGACEASGAHPEHYVLRLPRPEPAGAVKGMLEKLRGLLDHLPLQELHQVKKEEIDDADPLSCGFVPPEPFNEDDDSEIELYEENEEPTEEARPPLDDNLSLTDLRPVNVDFTSNIPTDTANIQHPANENSPDKVCLDLGNRSSRKVLIRLKKLSKVNDDSAVKCSVVRPCEGEIETKSGARAASGVSVTKLMTGVAKSGPGVTTSGAGVTTSGAGMTTSGAGMTTSGAGVTTSGDGVTTVRTDVTASGAGVTTSGASVTSVGAGSRVSGAPVVIPVVKLARMDDRLLRGEGTWTLIP